MSQPNFSSVASTGHASRMDRYYRFHAKIYDATRWSFLFGREALIRQVAA
jgi:S-adenosylmethionine-diacylgycerolhomoserine-N-methlytransferase